MKSLLSIFSLCALGVILCLVSRGFAGTSLPLTVLNLSPAPNYHRCTDPQDPIQLTDGRTEEFPIWIHSGCVGWQGNSSAKILLQVGNSSLSQALSGAIFLHTAKGTYADVEVPGRVDVYTQESSGEFYHVAGLTLFADLFADRNNHWIRINVDHILPRILVIVRASGPYIFLDEIRWESAPPALPKIHNLIGDVNDCDEDSLARFRQSLAAKRTAPPEIVQGWVQAFGEEKMVSWIVDNPFEPLPSFPTAEDIKKAQAQLSLFGHQSELESACFGFLNTGVPNRLVTVSIQGEGSINSWINVREVRPIVAANTSVVYDPLLPLENNNSLIAPARQAGYLWLTVDFRLAPPGRHQLSIVLRESEHGLTRSIPVRVEVLPDTLSMIRRPSAITWGYVQNLPIWIDPRKALDDLLEHGVNVFVIHPSSIPRPSLDGSWDSTRSQKLASDVALFRGKGLILLCLGWAQGGFPSWLDPLHGVNIPGQKAAIQSWARQLLSFLEGLGVKPEDWALYPVDEIRDADLEYMRELATWIKEEDPNIQLYSTTLTSNLESLAHLIDIWQPMLQAADGPRASFFARLSQPWWVYNVPGSPAKAASPWQEYRLLAWKAWAAGAKGIGFWSYSDTSGTTAWDDFDGRRPDYAVVYEGADGPISSRRWEAFREGVEDFQLLEAVQQGDLPSSATMAGSLKSQVQRFLNRSEVSLLVLDALRKEMM